MNIINKLKYKLNILFLNFTKCNHTFDKKSTLEKTTYNDRLYKCKVCGKYIVNKDNYIKDLKDYYR